MDNYFILADGARFPGRGQRPRISHAGEPHGRDRRFPHYFGPYPNWANSPFTLPNATVEIPGDGIGATAVAQVDPVTQGIASIQVTSPGSGYTDATVAIGGGDGTATATPRSTLQASSPPSRRCRRGRGTPRPR